MGSLIGHVLPGTAFAVLGVWWTFDFLRRFFEARFRRLPLILHHSTAYVYANGKTTRIVPVPVPGRRFPPWETCFRLSAILVGVVGEFWTALDDRWRFVTVHNAQHMTMFAFFLLPTLFELLYFYRVPGMPASLDVIGAGLAFAVEAVLFAWHLHGRSALDVQAHTFLVYAIAGCVAALVVEGFCPGDVRPCLMRSGFTLLQGAWFYTVGLVLYPPEGWVKWKEDDHAEMMLVSMMFAWNLAAVVVFQLGMAVFTFRWTKRRMTALGFKVGKAEEEEGYTRLPQQSDATTGLLRDDE